MDMTPIYRKATTAHVPHAAICLDPFHVVKWAGEALDLAFNTTTEQGVKISVDGLTHAKRGRGSAAPCVSRPRNTTRYAPRSSNNCAANTPRLHRAWRLKEDLRHLYQIPAAEADEHLRRWIKRAVRSGINAFSTLARRLRRHRDGILNAIHLQLSNSLLEGINAGIRLIQRRAHGNADLDNLIEMIYFCHGRTTTPLPTQTH